LLFLIFAALCIIIAQNERSYRFGRSIRDGIKARMN
jgi:hypothetical protein